jgi:hypothetical protein
MKHPLILILVALFCQVLAFGQTGVINQKFTDDQHKPIDGLFVQLMKANDSSLVLSSFSDAKGNVQFVNVKEGSYFTYIAPFTYEAYRSPKIVVSQSLLIVTLPNAVLQSKALKEVTVTAQVPFVERQPDMTVINVDRSPMSAGSSTMDVLERSPGVIIDQNDNLNLQGKSGVTVMIDGKKVVMSGSELADMLRGMPADAIEKIELITNPGVKYDAEGTGGIINIVLKKGKLLGLNGTINLGYGQGIYPKSTDGFSLNDRTKKFNLFLNYDYSNRKNLKIVSMDQSFYNGVQLSENIQQNSYYTIPNVYNIIHAGADFYASDRTSFGFTLDGYTRKFQYNETNSATIDSIGRPQVYSNTIASDNGTETQYATELNFKHRFDSSGNKSLSVLVNYTNHGFNDAQQFVNSYSSPENVYVQPPLVNGQAPLSIHVYTAQADYNTLISPKNKLEAGIKTIYTTIDANTQFFLGTNNLAPMDTAQTEHFIFNQNIYAAYINFSRTLRRGGISIGLRAEQTFATGNLVTTGEKINENYLYFFPHLTYSDTLNKFNNLEASAGTRFNRPGYDQLNPFKNYLNPTAYSQGNPDLLPEYEYNISVSDVYKTVCVATLTYAITQRPEETVHIPAPDEPGVTLITNENLQLKNYCSFSISASPQLTKWWTTNTYGAVFYNQYMADVSQTPINTGKLVFQGNSDNDFVLSKMVSLEINGQYSSGGYWGYFQSAQHWVIGGGMQTRCLKDRCIIKLSVSDIFNTNYYSTSSTVNNYTESYRLKRDSRVASISLIYKFGKNYQPEQEKTRSNDIQPDNSPKGL